MDRALKVRYLVTELAERRKKSGNNKGVGKST